jgi:hypothetical protein
VQAGLARVRSRGNASLIIEHSSVANVDLCDVTIGGPETYEFLLPTFLTGIGSFQGPLLDQWVVYGQVLARPNPLPLGIVFDPHRPYQNTICAHRATQVQIQCGLLVLCDVAGILGSNFFPKFFPRLFPVIPTFGHNWPILPSVLDPARFRVFTRLTWLSYKKPE